MAKPEYTLTQLATHLGGVVQGEPDYKISGLATLEQAGVGELSFFANARYLKALRASRAGAVLVTEQHRHDVPANAIVLPNPYLAFARASQLFDPTPPVAPGIGAGAVIDAGAEVSAEAQVCANAVVGAGTFIAAGVYIGPNVVIGRNCRIESGVRVNAGAILYDDVKVGANSLIHSGAVIGADGFGFANERGRWVKISQLGGVSIGSDVEIGAGTTIDRGALSDTVIANGVKLDNQIQIAHNVTIGENTAIAGCTAVAGSTKIGARCTIAGAVGIAGHLEIAEGVHITAMTLVTKSIKKSGAYSSGTGQMPYQDWKKSVVRFRQLDELAKRVKSLETKVETSKGLKTDDNDGCE
jgi:UDP-3-O-[3-hydroxymyristoyl] glucosamine N-acyltransferase